MVYDLTMLKTFYAAYSEKIERVRNVLRRPMTLAEKKQLSGENDLFVVSFLYLCFA